MKFNCDNCGAQYLIADEKLGARGVKVRCKKCSYVIILRPDGFEPKAAKNGASKNGAYATVSPTEPLTAAANAPSDATLPGEIVAATSSELGLSQEFTALGFDDDGGPQAPSRNMSLSVGLDVGGIAEGLAEQHSSPFSSERTGGSLDFVPDRPSVTPSVVPAKPYGDDATEVLAHGGGLGHAQPRVGDDDEDEEVATRVEAREDLFQTALGGAPFGDEATAGIDAAPGDDAVGFSAGGSAAFDDDDMSASSSDPADAERPSSFDLGAEFGGLDATDAGFGDEATVGEGAAAPRDDSSATGDLVAPASDIDSTEDGEGPNIASDVLAALAAVEGDADEGAWRPDSAPDLGEVTRSDDHPDDADALAAGDDAGRDPVDGDDADLDDALSSMQVNELADMRSSIDAELENLSSQIAPFSGAADAPPTTVGPPPVAEETPPPAPEDVPLVSGFDADENPLGQDESVEAELGTAFAAMFDGDGESGDGESAEDDDAAVLAALGETAAPAQQTRVFDTEAMAQVQAEQDIAGRSEVREWYVAINDEQVGPLNHDELEAKWKTGEIGPNTLCWKQGMGDWTAIRFTEGLEALAKGEAVEPTPVPDETPSEDVEAAPPQLAIAPDEPEPAVVASPASESTDDEPAWRPSAASALASLAAEELSSVPDAPAASTSSSSLPGASDALEKLLEGEGSGPAATMFGAAEKSESAVRPLPRRADTVSSIPLRDPTIERSKKSYAIPLAIVGGFLVLAVCITLAITLTSRPDGERAPAAGGSPTTEVAAVAAPPPPPVAPPPVVPPPPPETAAPTEAAAVVAAVDEPEEKVEVAEEPPVKRKTTRRRRSRRTERAAPPPPPPPPVEEPPPPRRATAKDETADLLGAARPSRRRVVAEPDNDLPRQLDDSDVLGVLRKNRNAVRTCLSKGSAADPALDGTMTVKMVIKSSGRPTRVAVAPDKFKSAVVGKCVVSAVKGWRFPKFSGPSMPIDFPVHVRGR